MQAGISGVYSVPYAARFFCTSVELTARAFLVILGAELNANLGKPRRRPENRNIAQFRG